MDLVNNDQAKSKNLFDEANEETGGFQDCYRLTHESVNEPFCNSINESLKNEIETEVEICPDITAVFLHCDDKDFSGFSEEEEGESDELEKSDLKNNLGSCYKVSQNDCPGPCESELDDYENCCPSRKLKSNASDFLSLHRVNTFECYHCKRSFVSDLKIRNHLKINPNNCEICHQEFFYKCLLNIHLKTHQTEERVCVACNSEFPYATSSSNVADLRRCEKCTQNQVESLRCKFCEAAFLERSLLDEHMKSHDPGKPYKCDICGQSFSQMQHIKRHIEVLHNGGVRYQCKHCKKCFRWDSCLRTHLKIHTSERPHKCSFCDYSFRRPCDLRRHMITHTNEKKFSCTQCDKLFTRNSSMLRHLRTHFGEKPYLCNVCGKRFNESFFLKEHMESHSENRSYYYCDWCHKRFNNRRVLRMHAKKHEKDEIQKLEIGNNSEDFRV